LKIQVNGEKEDRRGRKLYPNDVIEIEGKTYTIGQ
jgi:ribosome-associated protein